MKRVFLVLMLSLVFNQVFAQNAPSLIISETEIIWENVSDRIIDDKDNSIVYISFKNGQTECVLSPEIRAYPSAGIERRTKLNALLSADKPIFIQGYKDFKGIVWKNEVTGCGGMVGATDKSPGNLLSLSDVKIPKSLLPVSLKFGVQNISLQCFDPTDSIACEAVRKYAVQYKLPEPVKDTIDIKNLDGLRYPAIKIKSSSYWKSKVQYFINGSECSVKNDSIVIPKNILSSIQKGEMAELTYKIELEHPYFGHIKEGKIAEVYLKDDNFLWLDFTKLSWKHLLYLLLLLPIIILIICRKKICTYLDNNKKKQRERIQQKYIEEIVNNKGSEEKLDIVKKLLSNEDIEFKTNIAGMLNIETPPNIDELKKEIENQKNEINVLSRQVATLKEDVITLENEKTSLENEKTSICSRLNNLTFENKVLAKKNSELEQTVNQLHLDVNGLKLIIANKDKQIELCLQRNKTLKDQLVRISRQNMYLLQIDDALKEASDEILNAFSEVEDGDLKKKLVLPLLNGVAGLDDGITTYYNRWQKQVMAIQNDFFGKDLYEMSDDEVKYKLVSGFLKNLAQGDTFSKLTRLYMYIQADWINEILIKNKFNVDKVEQIFNRLKMLFNEFGIEIIYPRLFVDHMDEQQYTFDPRCEVFKLFPISEDMRILYSKQTDLIIDIVQIGVKIPAEQYSRKAIVSIPNF